MKWSFHVALALVAAQVASASVIGIDFGSAWMKVRRMFLCFSPPGARAATYPANHQARRAW